MKTVSIVFALAMVAAGAHAVVVSGYSTATGVASLPNTISASDLINGMFGAVEAGGFHAATPAPGEVDLTDGVPGAGVEAILADFSTPALQIRYDLPAPTDIQKIHVFSENWNNGNPNGRPGQSYQVEFSLAGDPNFTQLAISNAQTANLVSTGTYGTGFGTAFSFATGTLVYDDTGAPLATNVDSIRFVFYNVSNTASAYWDPFDAGHPDDVDGQAAAIEASIIKEIDVFAVPEPSTFALIGLGALGLLRRFRRR